MLMKNASRSGIDLKLKYKSWLQLKLCNSINLTYYCSFINVYLKRDKKLKY